MNKPDITKLMGSAKKFLSKRSPEILTGVGIAGMVSTVVLAVRATPKALEIIDKEKMSREDQYQLHVEQLPDNAVIESPAELTKLEIVKLAWKPYIPAVVTGVASIACLIGANSVHVRRHAALYSAYQISTTALKDYKEKVVETIGEKKEKTVREKVAKKQVEENPVSNAQIIMTGKGNTLMYDTHSDRYFRSDIDKIRNAVLTLNERMINGSEMYISLNEFYDEIGLKHTDSGDLLGWRIDRGKLFVTFSAVVTEDNEACIVIDHLTPPEYGFDQYF